MLGIIKVMKIRTLIILIGIFVFGFEVADAQLANSAWPIFHGNAQHTGLSPYDTSHVDGTVKWIFETGSSISSSPVIDEDGVIYFSADNGYLYAVKKDGELEWKTKLGTPYTHGYGGYVGYSAFPSAGPTVDKDGNLYITTREQDLVAVDPNGNVKWRFPLNITFDHWGTPVIGDDGTIYVNGSPPDEDFYPVDGSPYIRNNPPDGGLYAITPDGKEKWHYKVGYRMFNSPTLGKDGTIYIAVMVGFNDTRLIALKKDGSVAWNLQFPDKKSIESSPTVADNGVIYLGSFDENQTGSGLFAVTKDKVLWHYTIGEKEVLSTPAIAKDGTIYVGSFTGIDKFFAINPDGTEKWHYDVGGSVESSPAIGADGTIYFGITAKYQGQSNFYAMNPDGTVKWKFSTKLHASIVSSPAIGSDGTVYVGAGDGNLYAFGEGVRATSVQQSYIKQEEMNEPPETLVPSENTSNEERYAKGEGPDVGRQFEGALGEDISRDLGKESGVREGLFVRTFRWFANLFSLIF